MSSKEEKKDKREEERAGGKQAPAGPAAAEAASDPAWKLILVLTLVCAVAGAALAAGHMVTADPIKKARYEFKLASVKKVLPSCENDPGDDTVEVELPSGEKTTAYRCIKDGEIAAVAFSLDTAKNENAPYSGKIEVLVGITDEGRIYAEEEKKKVGVAVLKHSETPGLGAKIEDWGFLEAFVIEDGVGRNLTKDGMSCAPGKKRCRRWAVEKDDPKGFVDAISGATISSRAMTEVVRRALGYFNEKSVRDEMMAKGSSK